MALLDTKKQMLSVIECLRIGSCVLIKISIEHDLKSEKKKERGLFVYFPCVCMLLCACVRQY